MKVEKYVCDICGRELFESQMNKFKRKTTLDNLMSTSFWFNPQGTEDFDICNECLEHIKSKMRRKK